nr:two-component regulator propeller domain-containing protein [Paraflavitalea speifideiaquila]
MRKLVIILILFITGGALWAQIPQYQFSRIDIGQGLSHNQVNAIIRDSKGFMWFGTMSGLNRYDGYTFTVFRHNLQDSSTIGDDFIVRINEGPGNALWVENRGGLNIYDPRTEKFDRNASAWLARYALPPAPITNIIHDRQGNYWFVMPQAGLYKYDSATGKTSRVYQSGTTGATLASAAADARGDLWVVFNNGHIERVDSRTGLVTFSTEVMGATMRHERLNYSLYIDAENELWLYVPSDTRGIPLPACPGLLAAYYRRNGRFPAQQQYYIRPGTG